MDIQMPIMDGFTATKEIRKIDNKAPVIVQTSYRIDKIKEIAIAPTFSVSLAAEKETGWSIHT